MKAPANAPAFAAAYPNLVAYTFSRPVSDDVSKLKGGENFNRELANILGIGYENLVRAMWNRESRDSDKEIEAEFVALRKLMRSKPAATYSVTCPVFPYNGETELVTVKVHNVADTQVVRVDFSWYSYCYTDRKNLGTNTFVDINILELDKHCDENGTPTFWEQ
jgi:hypothetical protein